MSTTRSLLLRRARVVLPNEVAEATDVLVVSGKIQKVFRANRLEDVAPDTEIDLSESTLFPGFIDVHIHGAVGMDTTTANPSQLAEVARFLASQGVTGWLPTVVPGSPEEYKRAAQAAAELMQENVAGARVLGIHYEGPFVNEAQCGALRTDYFRTYSSPADLDQLPVPHAANSKRMMTVAPEIDGGIELIRELTQRNWVVSIGHTRAAVDILDRAREAGARHMTHFMNAMAPLHHRAPGPVGWGLLHEDVTCDVIADGVHLDLLVLRLLVQVKSPARLCLISDAIAAAGMGDGNYEIWGETIEVTNGRTRNRHGSIAGSVISMLDAVNMMRSVGVREVELAQMAASNPAALLGIASECGSIEEGKRADLVALDSEGKVTLTLINGEVAFRSEG